MAVLARTIEEIIDLTSANPEVKYAPADFGLPGIMRANNSVAPYPPMGAVETMLGAEWEAIARFWANEFLEHFQQRDVNIFSGKWPNVVASALAAKNELNGVIGMNGKAQIIPSLIRPVTAYAQTAAEVQNWLKSSVTAGWNAAVFNINLNYNGTSLVLQPFNRVTMLLLGIFDTESSPKLFEYQVVDATGSPQGVHSLPLAGMLGNISVYPFAQSRYISKTDTNKIDLNYLAGGAAQPGLVGIQWQRSEYATAETAGTQ